MLFRDMNADHKPQKNIIKMTLYRWTRWGKGMKNLLAVQIASFPDKKVAVTNVSLPETWRELSFEENSTSEPNEDLLVMQVYCPLWERSRELMV